MRTVHPAQAYETTEFPSLWANVHGKRDLTNICRDYESEAIRINNCSIRKHVLRLLSFVLFYGPLIAVWFIPPIASLVLLLCCAGLFLLNARARRSAQAEQFEAMRALVPLRKDLDSFVKEYYCYLFAHRHQKWAESLAMREVSDRAKHVVRLELQYYELKPSDDRYQKVRNELAVAKESYSLHCRIFKNYKLVGDVHGPLLESWMAKLAPR